MNAKDYRLGNLVRDKVSGEWMRIDGLGVNTGIEIYVLNRDKFPLADGWQMEPIPLSPELLEKCGFKCIAEGRDYFELKDLRIFLHRGEWAVELGIRVSVQYLHQLQNLAYCLGTELNVPLNL